MNLLITGGFGHIGSKILSDNAFFKLSKKIIVIDNNSNNKLNTIFFNKKKFKLIVGDLTKKKTLNNLKEKIDIIIHLASQTNAEASLKMKNFIYKNNLGSFKNIINFAKKNNSKIVHISSTSIYGSNSDIVYEDCKDLFPQSPYADVKIQEEKILKKNKKIKFITLRFGTIVGFSYGMRFHTAVNKFCYNAIMNLPIPVWKTALNQYRPYLALNDAIDVLKYILKYQYFDNKCHNVVSKNFTVNQILSIIRTHSCNIKVKLVNSKIMNQLSYHVLSKSNLLKKIKLKKRIKREIKNVFKAMRCIN